MIAETKVGPQTLTDGATGPVRSAKDGTTIVGQGLGTYEEICRRGLLLSVSTPMVGVTVAAAHVSPLAAGTGQAIAGLFNPVGSGYDLVILRTKLWLVSGTPGGPFGWNVIPANAGITATAVQGRRHDTGNLDGPLCGFVGTTALTGSSLASMLRGLGGPAAIAAGAGVYSVEEETAGDIVVKPGGFAGLAATAASGVMGASITYALRTTNGP